MKQYTVKLYFTKQTNNYKRDHWILTIAIATKKLLLLKHKAHSARMTTHSSYTQTINIICNMHLILDIKAISRTTIINIFCNKYTMSSLHYTHTLTR